MELQLPEGGPAGESGVGAAFVWGENSSGQLLLPTFESQRLPAKVPGLSSMAELSCGSFHSIAVTAMGELLSGGLNTEGQTGTGKHEPDTPREPVASTEDEEATEFVPPAPRPIEALMTKKCVQVACGYAHSVALTADHAVFGWGSNNIGQCGQADCERVLRPRRVDLPAPAACLAAGASHTLVVTQGAALYSFGTNYHGECGRGTTISPCPPGRVELGGTLAMDCAAGESHSAVLGTSGAVLTFGDTRKGACGASKDGHSPQLLPAQIVSFRNSRDGPYLDGVRPPIVDVSCSATATIMADKDGSVYCCGELAGSAFTVATKLRGFVPDGATIHELAAGEQHVLAVCSGEIGAEVFGTGDNTAGQLGTADGSSKVQLPVLGPHETYHISAAGAQSACVVIPTDNESAPRIWRAQLQESLQAVRFLGNPDARPAAVVSVEAVFSSSALLVAAFASSEHDFCSVDVGQLESTYKALLIQGKKDPSLLSTLLSASRRCIQDGLVAPEAAAQTDMLQNILYPCLIIMQNPLSWTGSAELALQCIRIVVRQAQSSEADAGSFQDAIRNCYRSNRQLLGARLVLPLHQLLERRLKSQNTVDANSIAAIGLLTVLHSASEAEARATGAPLVPAERWYNSYISAHWPIEQDYAAWRQGGGFAEGGFSICATPYLLDVAAKQRVLRVENDITTRQAVHSSHMRAYFQQGLRGTEVASEFLFRKPRRGGAGPPSHPQYRRDLATHPTYLVLQVRRDHLLEDLMEELAPRTREALTQPLKVIFLGEEGVDEGGLRKELFQLVTEQMFQPAFGLWVHDDATRTWWFQSDGPNSDEEQNVEYFLIGLVIGLAIHNGVILDLSFPRLVWSKLLGNEVGLSDLTDAFPETGAGLHRLLEWNSELDGGSIADVFCLDFTATVQHLDTTHTVELCPGGADIDVTEENRTDYAASFAKWRMHDSVAQAFGSFRRGFLLLCDGLHLGLFSATELEELVCGSRHLDFAELQAYTRYEGFTEHSPTVVHFWEVAHELSTEEKKLLLTFATGTDRAPLGGLKNLEPKFAIQRAGPDSMLLPTSHTCFNVLCLPEYKTRAKLRSLLHTAIHNAAGFGFA